MPTVLVSGPYRFFFYSADRTEPPHVHVSRDKAVAKYWLAPTRYEHGVGFRPHELRRIRSIIKDREHELLVAWNEFFSQ